MLLFLESNHLTHFFLSVKALASARVSSDMRRALHCTSTACTHGPAAASLACSASAVVAHVGLWGWATVHPGDRT